MSEQKLLAFHDAVFYREDFHSACCEHISGQKWKLNVNLKNGKTLSCSFGCYDSMIKYLGELYEMFK